jgi:hypothetical protein
VTTPEIIAACAKTTQKPFLVIGGHAVIAHGYSRNTVDLDLLVRQADRETWTKALAALGYESCHTHENFEQFRSASQDIDLDLMFVSEATFEGIFATSKETSFGSIASRIPSLQHLIALKLHVLKQGLEHRVLGDLDDVIQLILGNNVDLDQEEWKQIFEKYGNQEIYEKVRHASRAS